jgi:hypothetical protein
MAVTKAERPATDDSVREPRRVDQLGGKIEPVATPEKEELQERGSGASTPELRRHRRAIEAGNSVDRLWMEDDRFDEIVSLCGIAASHCTSAAEAAWRRDKALTGTHLRHAREGLMLALKTYNMIPALSVVR